MKFQGDILNFCDFIQVFVFTTNHHLKLAVFTIIVYVNIIVDIYLFIDWFISESVLVIPEGLNRVCRHQGLGKK